MPVRIFLLLVSTLAVVPCVAAELPRPDATLCELAAHPERYAGFHLLVRADVSFEVDSYAVSDTRCPDHPLLFDFQPAPGSRAELMMHESIYKSPVKGVLIYGHLRTTLPSSPPDFVADQVLAFPPDHRWHVHRDAAGNIVRGGP